MKRLTAVCAFTLLTLCACSQTRMVRLPSPPSPPGFTGATEPTYVRVPKKPPVPKEDAAQGITILEHEKLGDRVICYVYREGRLIPNWHSKSSTGGRVIVYWFD